MSDSISDFLNTLKLTNRAGKESFSFPASRLIVAVVEVLRESGFIKAFLKKGKKGRFLEVILAYDAGKPKVENVRRVSRLSQRVYRGWRELRPVRNGFGIAVLSTPRGVLSDKGAKDAKVGGEVLCEIW